jgi:hypothetical protein
VAFVALTAAIVVATVAVSVATVGAGAAPGAAIITAVQTLLVATLKSIAISVVLDLVLNVGMSVAQGKDLGETLRGVPMAAVNSLKAATTGPGLLTNVGGASLSLLKFGNIAYKGVKYGNIVQKVAVGAGQGLISSAASGGGAKEIALAVGLGAATGAIGGAAGEASGKMEKVVDIGVSAVAAGGSTAVTQAIATGSVDMEKVVKNAARAGMMASVAGAAKEIGGDNKVLTAVADTAINAGVGAANASLDGKVGADMAMAAAAGGISAVGGHVDVSGEEGKDGIVKDKYLGAALRVATAAGGAAVTGDNIGSSALSAVQDSALGHELQDKAKDVADEKVLSKLESGGFLKNALAKVQGIAAKINQNKLAKGVIAGVAAAAVTIAAVAVVSKILDKIPTEREVRAMKEEGKVEGDIVVQYVNLPGQGGRGGCGSGCNGGAGYILLERLDD